MHISSRKKPGGPSARRRAKCSQSESASSNAKNISESSDSENGPGQDAASASQSTPLKAKSVGKGGTGKRNSKRVAERVLNCMQKRQKKIVASDSDSIVSAILCSIDLQYKFNYCQDIEETSYSLQDEAIFFSTLEGQE